MPPGANVPVAIWNAMGGQIDWSAVEILAEIHGVIDIPLLVEQLIAIRTHLTPDQQDS